MTDHADSSDRNAADFILFALGFLGFLLAATGVVVASVAGAVMGGLLMVLAVSCFLLRPSPGD